MLKWSIIATLLLIASCDHRWYGLDYELDEYPDSETGVVETYCRAPKDAVVESDWRRVREIQALWAHAEELYPDRMPRDVRVIYVNSPDDLVPCGEHAVPWSEWPAVNGHDPAINRGFCVWAWETPDGHWWLIVATYHFKQPLPILAHELSHALFPGLDHGETFDAVILSLLTGRLSDG